MKKLFLMASFVFATILGSAQFMVITTIDAPEDAAKWEMSNITDNMGLGYMLTDKNVIGRVKSEEEYEL